MKIKNSLTVAQFVGSFSLFAGAVLKFFTFTTANYVFAVGAFILLVLQVLNLIQSQQEDVRVLRLHRILLLVTAMLGVAAYFMFIGKNTWMPLLLAYAITSLYLSFRFK